MRNVDMAESLVMRQFSDGTWQVRLMLAFGDFEGLFPHLQSYGAQEHPYTLQGKAEGTSGKADPCPPKVAGEFQKDPWAHLTLGHLEGSK